MENVMYCQSCGMPMTTVEMHGKNADGSKSEDYCQYCFPNGAFNNPNETLEEMIETCVPYMVKSEENPDGFPDGDSARKMLQEQLPKLKRWK